MKKVELLYKTETIDRFLILEYHYDVHAWRYDVKYWLVDNWWCEDLEGKRKVSELKDFQKEVIDKYMPIIKQHENENRNWLAFQNCNKRTCICKSCDKFCNCGSCKGKINDCEEKNN